MLRAVTIAALSVLFSVPAAAQDFARSVEGQTDRVKLTLSLEKTEYVGAEPILARITLSNSR